MLLTYSLSSQRRAQRRPVRDVRRPSAAYCCDLLYSFIVVSEVNTHSAWHPEPYHATDFGHFCSSQLAAGSKPYCAEYYSCVPWIDTVNCTLLDESPFRSKLCRFPCHTHSLTPKDGRTPSEVHHYLEPQKSTSLETADIYQNLHFS